MRLASMQHQPHHQQQGSQPSQHLHNPRPRSAVQQHRQHPQGPGQQQHHHHHQQHHATQQQQQPPRQHQHHQQHQQQPASQPQPQHPSHQQQQHQSAQQHPHHQHHPQHQPQPHQHQQTQPQHPTQQRHPSHSQSQPQAQPQPQQHHAHFASPHPLSPAYQAGAQGPNHQDGLNYYNHPSPYSTPGANSGYTSADTSDMMAAAQMPRPPYPPMSYHTPQSNSPASVASPSQHDQHRSLYGQAPSQHLQQYMYYHQSQHYQSIPPHPAASPYAQHAHHPHQQPMTSQPGLIMSHAAQQNPMAQHGPPPPHAAQAMTSSPRPKMEPQVPVQLGKPTQTSHLPQVQHQHPHPLPHQHPHQQAVPHLQSPGSQATSINPNAAPGPIPATTPLVVRQDNNGVQWIAFEYSRDRVKMEYTIRCDVESVQIESLSAEFKQNNCVYPRACCTKEQYRGNRLMYETECNRVGWALAQLNPPLRGKRGLIQRAVDSWRNSNRDPRLRSRRVRRMAKMGTRKQGQGAAAAAAASTPTPHPTSAHLPGPSGPAGMPAASPVGQGGAAAAAAAVMGAGAGPGPGGKPAMGAMGPSSLHHHPGAHHEGGGAPGGGDEVGPGNMFDGQQGHPAALPQEHAAAAGDVRQAHVFTGFNGQGYPAGASRGPVAHMAPRAIGAVPAKRPARACHVEPDDLFPDIPEAKKRKFILVEDHRGSRLRVRVTLDGVETNEISDSFRKGASVYPRSYFPREMQSPPPSATGSRFFSEDVSDDGIVNTEGRDACRRRSASSAASSKPPGEAVRVSTATDSSDGGGGEVTIPRMRKPIRSKEVRLSDLGYRMAWLQSRVFAGRTVLLQRALDTYRNKTRATIECSTQEGVAVASHYETRTGKRRWGDRRKRGSQRGTAADDGDD